jgi:hypothetical protein
MKFTDFLNTVPMTKAQRHNAQKLVKFGKSRYVRIVYLAHAREIATILQQYNIPADIDTIFRAAETNEW